ncbi:Reverse transcriptase (RNA-dependent DNA polymerase) [Popillia japonica]|uniref:Reverse transcriptase (RNA-dependent DNA polymerase) n=1 Tax=Popillia japonica TaxID=7064 RepID=A0AAW1KJ79_POPJA
MFEQITVFSKGKDKTKNVYCIGGMIWTINAVLLLWQDIKENYKFLSTYNLNHDPIENFFSVVRHRGGYNPYPNCRQFRLAMQHNMFIRLQNETTHSNCELDEEVEHLTIDIQQKHLESSDTAHSRDLIQDDNRILMEDEPTDDPNVVSLDVRKAFDTVSHSSICRALQRLGIDEGTSNYITASLSDSTTTIRVGPGSQTRKICIRRGVKQGDPLSPFLFNAVLDELLCSLQSTPGIGGTIGEEKIPVLAFADDLLLLEDNDVLLPTTLATVANFFRLRGMSLNAKKSVSISVAASGGVCIPRTKPFLRVDNVLLPVTDRMQTFRYLGHFFGLSGAAKPTVYNLSRWLKCVEAAPLKPEQKLSLIREHVVPEVRGGGSSETGAETLPDPRTRRA